MTNQQTTYNGGPAPTLNEKIVIMGAEIDHLRGIQNALVKALEYALNHAINPDETNLADVILTTRAALTLAQEGAK